MRQEAYKACVVPMLLLAIVVFWMAGCAVTSQLFPSPEAQIVNGANTVTAATTLATVLLRNDRISVTQAKSYRALLGTASAHLDDANKALLTCRGKTGSSASTNPDPCAPTVIDDIRLALSVAGQVKATLDGK